MSHHYSKKYNVEIYHKKECKNLSQMCHQTHHRASTIKKNIFLCIIVTQNKIMYRSIIEKNIIYHSTTEYLRINSFSRGVPPDTPNIAALEICWLFICLCWQPYGLEILNAGLHFYSTIRDLWKIALITSTEIAPLSKHQTPIV